MGFMSDLYKEEKEKKKFQLTRGMLILGIVILVVIIAIIIIVVSVLSKNKPDYTKEDFEKLEARMVEEAPIYVSQKNISLTTAEIRIDLKDMLINAGGSIDPDKIKAAKICEGYVVASKAETESYRSYIKCKNLYTTKGYVDEHKTTTMNNDEEKDNTKPVITLVGEKEMNVTQGSSFKDPGTTATDNKDGDITSQIKVSGSVDTSKVGEYTLTYQVTDKAGNKAEEKRKVTVVAAPTTTPSVNTTVKTTTKKSTNNNRPSGSPSITLRGNNPYSMNVGSSYHEPGYSARNSIGGDITASVRVTNNINTGVAGTYYVNYTVTDSYGKSASATRTVIVRSSYVALSGISLSPNSFTLSVGASRTLQVYFNPTNASNKSVTWSTSNANVATVSGGTIYAMSRGTAVITVYGADGKSASARVTVR